MTSQIRKSTRRLNIRENADARSQVKNPLKRQIYSSPTSCVVSWLSWWGWAWTYGCLLVQFFSIRTAQYLINENFLNKSAMFQMLLPGLGLWFPGLQSGSLSLGRSVQYDVEYENVMILLYLCQKFPAPKHAGAKLSGAKTGPSHLYNILSKSSYLDHKRK